MKSGYATMRPNLLSVYGILTQLDAASVAEPLEKVWLITPHLRENLVYCPVRFRILINNALAAFFSRGQDGVGRDEPDTAESGVKLYERVRTVQRMIPRVGS
jgi:hypothetical protein